MRQIRSDSSFFLAPVIKDFSTLQALEKSRSATQGSLTQEVRSSLRICGWENRSFYP